MEDRIPLHLQNNKYTITIYSNQVFDHVVGTLTTGKESKKFEKKDNNLPIPYYKLDELLDEMLKIVKEKEDGKNYVFKENIVYIFGDHKSFFSEKNEQYDIIIYKHPHGFSARVENLEIENLPKNMPHQKLDELLVEIKNAIIKMTNSANYGGSKDEVKRE